MYTRIQKQGAAEYHRLEVSKLRGMHRLEGLHTYTFSSKGIVFYPRLESLIRDQLNSERFVNTFDAGEGNNTELAEELEMAVASASVDDTTGEEVAAAVEEESRQGFGLLELEKMLNGGLPVGSSTFVAGSPGVGKTLLSLHYLMQGTSKGEVGLYVGFLRRSGSFTAKGS